MDIDFSKLQIDEIEGDTENVIPAKQNDLVFKEAPRQSISITTKRETTLVNNILSNYTKYLIIALLSFVIFLIANNFLAIFTVSGPSMYPAFTTGDKVVLDSFSTRFRLIDRGDVIAFIHVRDPKNPDLLKRVIALPGETISVSTTTSRTLILDPKGDLYVYQEDGSLRMDNTLRLVMPYTVLGPDDYYLMGDNRVVSKDSRKFGTVQPSEMIGKVWFKF